MEAEHHQPQQQQQRFLQPPRTHLTLVHPSHSQPPFLAHPLLFSSPVHHTHFIHFHQLQQHQHQQQLQRQEEHGQIPSEREPDQIHHPIGLHPLQVRHTIHQPQPHQGHSLLPHHRNQTHFQLIQFDQAQLPGEQQQDREPTSENNHDEDTRQDPEELNGTDNCIEKNYDGSQIQGRDNPSAEAKRPLAPIATSLGDPGFGGALASIQIAVTNQALQNQTNLAQIEQQASDPGDTTVEDLPESHEQGGLQDEAHLEHTSSPCVQDSHQPKEKKKRKRIKQVQFQLDPLVHQKLMRIVYEQYNGSVEKFVTTTLNSSEASDKPGKKTVTRKPTLSKWKRTRFEQMKGSETQELTMAFRSLAESTPRSETVFELLSIPWQELTMSQIEKMLEETKRMLFLNEKVHDCTECGKRFATPSSLKDHMNEHSGVKPYKCKFKDCAMHFKSKQLLCRHLKKHECAHRCTFEGCGKRFAFRERLIVHQKIHSSERPLVCPWEGCGKRFKWTNSLQGHKRTHTGEKPFQCTFQDCGRHFGYKVDLTRHVRTHYGEPARASH
ncbi:hypothetical protein SUGI_1057380 [Cryptomeria japonica]|nr:uncharacterized protein LOC131060761 [Cryptomeria japonica]GLJ49792.1 hypothetical protein SUGI_1057380 [Cryptomeria japonica]